MLRAKPNVRLVNSSSLRLWFHVDIRITRVSFAQLAIAKPDERGRWQCRVSSDFFDEHGIHRQPEAKGKPSAAGTPCDICGVTVSVAWRADSFLYEAPTICRHCDFENDYRHTLQVPSKRRWQFDERNVI